MQLPLLWLGDLKYLNFNVLPTTTGDLLRKSIITFSSRSSRWFHQTTHVCKYIRRMLIAKSTRYYLAFPCCVWMQFAFDLRSWHALQRQAQWRARPWTQGHKLPNWKPFGEQTTRHIIENDPSKLHKFMHFDRINKI